MDVSAAPAMPSHGTLSACHECDLLLVEQTDIPPGAKLRCPRCNALLYRADDGSLERILALALAALILFLIGNLSPMVGLDIKGHRVETTLIGAAQHLWNTDMEIVSCLVGATTIVMPAVQLSALVWMVFPLCRGIRPPGFALIFRVMKMAYPWGMVEVFLLGVLVSLVKLEHLADVLPGPGIWAFGALMLVVTELAATIDPRVLWESWEQAE